MTTPAFGAFTVKFLMGVIASLKTVNSGMLDQFFPNIKQFNTLSVSIDREIAARTLAPLQHPSLPGKVRAGQGFRTKELVPAYIKQKALFNPDQAFSRAMGESFGGELTPQQRIDMAVATELKRQIDAIKRRQEHMAVSALVSGTITLSGDGYPTTVVDFERDSTLQVAANTLTSGDRWSETTSNPLKDLDTVSKKTAKKEGTPILDVVMDLDAWDYFRNHAKIQKVLDMIKYDAGALASLTPASEGLQLRGTAGGYRIWTYTGFFVNDANSEVESFSGGKVVGVGAIEGTQLFGAIQDLKAGMQSIPIFPKSWEEEDPSGVWLMTQSAPLVAPLRPDASVSMQVL